ncbi:MAG: nitrous oxide-stimulated promoter family protein [Deltaproteobacteria bacterium]|nr:nitrous oxide-stimulated promoter family protein [Deltaproteobacteria bacterium]
MLSTADIERIYKKKISALTEEDVELTDELRHKLDHDLGVLRAFTEVFCHKKHGHARGTLCPDCERFLDYAYKRRILCPMDPKPKCQACPVHCYKPAMRDRVKKIMHIGGMHYVLRGRIDWLIKYFVLRKLRRTAA